MSYTEYLDYRDVEVEFEYDYNGEELVLLDFYYDGPMEWEKFIKDKIDDFLFEEFTHNGINYIQDYKDGI